MGYTQGDEGCHRFYLHTPFHESGMASTLTEVVKVCTYIKTNTVFGLSKYSCIKIDQNIFGINSLFFYENQRFIPQGDPLYSFQIFSRVSKSEIFSLYIKTNTEFLLSKYSSIKIDKNFMWTIIYFAMKIEDSDHRGIHFRFFRACQS